MYVHGHLTNRKRKWYQFMLDIAWPELMIIGIVAVVAIGPKDLPKVMHSMGKWAGKARGIAQEFQRSLEQLNYEADIADKMKSKPQAQQASGKHHPKVQPVDATSTSEEPHDHLGST